MKKWQERQAALTGQCQLCEGANRRTNVVAKFIILRRQDSGIFEDFGPLLNSLRRIFFYLQISSRKRPHFGPLDQLDDPAGVFSAQNVSRNAQSANFRYHQVYHTSILHLRPFYDITLEITLAASRCESERETRILVAQCSEREFRPGDERRFFASSRPASR